MVCSAPATGDKESPLSPSTRRHPSSQPTRSRPRTTATVSAGRASRESPRLPMGSCPPCSQKAALTLLHGSTIRSEAHPCALLQVYSHWQSSTRLRMPATTIVSILSPLRWKLIPPSRKESYRSSPCSVSFSLHCWMRLFGERYMDRPMMRERTWGGSCSVNHYCCIKLSLENSISRTTALSMLLTCNIAASSALPAA